MTHGRFARIYFGGRCIDNNLPGSGYPAFLPKRLFRTYMWVREKRRHNRPAVTAAGGGVALTGCEPTGAMGSVSFIIIIRLTASSLCPPCAWVRCSVLGYVSSRGSTDGTVVGIINRRDNGRRLLSPWIGCSGGSGT